MTFPSPVTEALRRLAAAGYEAYAVGGCVRDLLRGGAPADYDITTSALPAEIRTVFAREKIVDTGARHGTLTVLLSGMPLEITTYRLETTYSDHRHPDTVRFTPSLREDLARRDFTVNAMAMAADGKIIDFFGGEQDLGLKILRCVGEPTRRFREDALRILRLLRFASKLGFEMERETLAAAEDHAPLLSYVSAERVRAELFGLLTGENAGRVFVLGGKILHTVLPECVSEDGRPPAGVCDLLSRLPCDLILRLCAVFLGKTGQNPAKTAETLLSKLKTDRKTKTRVIALLENLDLPLQTDAELLFACRTLTPEGTDRLLTLRGAMARDGDGEAWNAKKRRLAALLESGRCYRPRDLKLDGDALRRLGVPAGKEMGEMLESLLAGAIRGEYANTPEALAAAVAALLEEKSNNKGKQTAPP